MQLFTDYLQPLTIWISVHPHWALLITFLISFSESLAIIGSIIPGSVTMTAIGILAGSGIMRIDLTLMAAILGAVAGDSISYMLGYKFRHQLVTIWPFSRYPNLLSYGKEYFNRHGGKSVLVGRFVGPLRSIIPVIAGMLHMNRWHFLIANVISAIGWSFLYVGPGILIGVASSELSAESASRLFVVILIFLIIAWLFTLGVKWLLIRINLLLRVNLHRFWLWSKEHPRMAFYFKLLTPEHEDNHYPTAALILLFILSLLISIIITALVIEGSLITEINNLVYLFLQSLRTKSFDLFFIIVSLFTMPISLAGLLLSITCYAIYYHDWRTLKYWLSLCFFCALAVFVLAFFIEVPETDDFIKHNIDLFYPAINLTFATSLFGFLIFYISTRYRTVVTLTIRVILIILLFLTGIATMYLGDNWLTSILGAYVIGFMICITHWIFYRRVSQSESRSQLPIVFSCMALILATGLSYFVYFNSWVNIHKTNINQYVLTETSWWNQHKPLLPLYTMNRIGKRTGLFNVQYIGHVSTLQQALTKYGWKKQSSSFFYTLLLRAGGKGSTEKMPLGAQLYLNRKPSLMMTYSFGENKPLIILRLWRSNYHLQNLNQPIWLGSLNVQPLNSSLQGTDPFQPFIQALPDFIFNRITLEKKYVQQLKASTSPIVLFIKEKRLEQQSVISPILPVNKKR